MRFTDADMVTRNSKVAQRMFEGRMLVITPLDSKLHRFNEVGTFIWQLLERPKTIVQISTAVADHFEHAGNADLQHDIESFLGDMQAKDLITVAAAKAKTPCAPKA
jgi:hypothetical protein